MCKISNLMNQTCPIVASDLRKCASPYTFSSVQKGFIVNPHIQKTYNGQTFTKSLLQCSKSLINKRNSE